ncbi:MAG: response regulator transcription factor [Bacteroidia bacterium]|nr:response regulator transcription factor [Bacteroidia bacterium]
MKILIVDDHVLVRKGLKGLLISCNPSWEVYEAINGIQAVIQAPKLQPDIILMDYSMPKLNGHKAAGQLIKDIPGIKIIMISGFISSENIRNLLQTGIKGIVSKTAGTE